eukprot:scaffold240908_cov25-Tisochrysis_lutea.AAC.1
MLLGLPEFVACTTCVVASAHRVFWLSFVSPSLSILGFWLLCCLVATNTRNWLLVGNEDARVGLRGSWGLRTKRAMGRFTILAPYAGKTRLEMLNNKYIHSWESKHFTTTLEAMKQQLLQARTSEVLLGSWEELVAELEVLGPAELCEEMAPLLQREVSSSRCKEERTRKACIDVKFPNELMQGPHQELRKRRDEWEGARL